MSNRQALRRQRGDQLSPSATSGYYDSASYRTPNASSSATHQQYHTYSSSGGRRSSIPRSASAMAHANRSPQTTPLWNNTRTISPSATSQNSRIPMFSTQHGRRRLSDAGIGSAMADNRTATTPTSSHRYYPNPPRPHNARDNTPSFAGHNSGGGARIPFPAMHYNSNEMGTTMADNMHTPYHHHAPEHRPDSRGSVHSATSAHTFMSFANGGTCPTGKAPFFVNNVKIDAKVVPPELDVVKQERRQAKRSAIRTNDTGDTAQARIRVRMDVAVSVLHPGEHVLDLLSVAEPQSQSMFPWLADTDKRQRKVSKVDGYPRIERAVYTVASTQYGRTDPHPNFESPMVSPRLATRQLFSSQDTTENHRSSSNAYSMSTSVDPFIPQSRPRQPLVYHGTSLSPYPPPPPKVAVDDPGSNSQEIEGEKKQLSSSADSAHYEAHTLASYSRAQERMSDRSAIYGDNAVGPVLTPTRRTSLTSGNRANTMSAIDPGYYDSPAKQTSNTRSVSVLGSGDWCGTAGQQQQQPSTGAASIGNQQLYPDRPHSTIGLVMDHQRRRARARSEITPLHFVDSQRTPMPHDNRIYGPYSPTSSTVSQLFTSSPNKDLCHFDTDQERGMFYVQFSEPRRYRITVWFSIRAKEATVNTHSATYYNAAEVDLSSTSSSESANGKDSDLSSIPSVYPWESGCLSFSGIPRSLQTRIRVRLPHRHVDVSDRGLTDTGKVLFGVAEKQSTPGRKLMQTSATDVSGSIRLTGSKLASLDGDLANSNIPSMLDFIGGNSGGGAQSCFYRVKMTQPARVEQSVARTMSARLASNRTPLRASGILFGQDPTSAGADGSGAGSHTAVFSTSTSGDGGDLAGWLNTDDSDMEELEITNLATPTIADSGVDNYAMLDMKIQNFIDENKNSGSVIDEEEPMLVDSEGKPELGAANQKRPKVRVNEFGSPVITNNRSLLTLGGSDIDSGQPGPWTRFSKKQFRVDGYDYQRTEMTTFKLKSVDTIAISWMPRLVEHCQPVFRSENLGSVRNEYMDASTIFFRRQPLETILSAESTPVDSLRMNSNGSQTFEHAQASVQASPQATVNVTPKDAANLETDSVDVLLVTKPEGLLIHTTIALSLPARLTQDGKEAVVGMWPKEIDLDIASLKYTIQEKYSASRLVVLKHLSVSVGWKPPSVAAAEANQTDSGSNFEGFENVELADSQAKSGFKFTTPQPSLSPEDSTGSSSSSSVLIVKVVSEPTIQMPLAAMILTNQLVVGVPKRMVVAPMTSCPASNISIQDHTSIWSTTEVVTADESSVLDGDVYHLVSIKRRSDDSSEQALMLSGSLQLQTICNELVDQSDKDSAASLLCLTGTSISVSVDKDTVDQPDLLVSTTISCRITRFNPWYLQLDRTNKLLLDHRTAPCLIIRIPDGYGTSWKVGSFEISHRLPLSTSTSCSAAIRPVALGPNLVAIPVLPLTSSTYGRSRDSVMLSQEVTTETVECVLSTKIVVSEAHPVPLPLPIIDCEDTVAVSLKGLDTGISLVPLPSRQTGAQPNVYIVSIACPALVQQQNSVVIGDSVPHLDSHGKTIICPMDLPTLNGNTAQSAGPLVEYRFKIPASDSLDIQCVPVKYADAISTKKAVNAASLTSSPSSAADSAEYFQSDQQSTGAIGDTLSLTTSIGISELYVDNSCSSSLRNRHIRTRTERSFSDADEGLPIVATPNQQHQEQRPVTESDPLLGNGNGTNTLASPGMAAATRVWQVARWVLRILICLSVMGLVGFIAVRYDWVDLPVESLPNEWMATLRHIAAVNINNPEHNQQMSLSIASNVYLERKGHAVMDQSVTSSAASLPPTVTDPLQISVVTSLPTRFSSGGSYASKKWRVRSVQPTSDPGSTQQSSPEPQSTPVESASSPLVGWFVSSILEPVLEMLGFR